MKIIWKRVKITKKEISASDFEDLKYKIKVCKERLTTLECPHDDTEFDIYCSLYPHTPTMNYIKRCKKCRKILKSYSDKKDFLVGNIQHVEESLNNLNKELEKEVNKDDK